MNDLAPEELDRIADWESKAVSNPAD